MRYGDEVVRKEEWVVDGIYVGVTIYEPDEAVIHIAPRRARGVGKWEITLWLPMLYPYTDKAEFGFPLPWDGEYMYLSTGDDKVINDILDKLEEFLKNRKAEERGRRPPPPPRHVEVMVRYLREAKKDADRFGEEFAARLRKRASK